MKQIVLGSTGIATIQNAFGALPVQRVEMREAVRLLREAFDGGMTFFDTARAYSDSEEKLGNAFEGARGRIFISSKTMAETPEKFWSDLETSLRMLKTDYIDIYQFHNPSVCYRPGDGTGMYECMLEAKKQGKIRHIGITNHRLAVAREIVDSGLYETLQFPFSYLSSEAEIDLVRRCEKANMGFIAMKALAGGLITNSAAAFAFMSQFDGVLPIWGIQHENELQEFLSYIREPAQLTPERAAFIDREKQNLTGEFCRGCGYCLPCPANIEIYTCARMSLMIRRSPSQKFLEPEAQRMMEKIEDCRHCGACKSRCPYGLDTPELLRKNYEDYKEILAGNRKVF